jgi:hypothetical protein
MTDDIFDFGFTAMDEDELTVVQQTTEQLTQVSTEAKSTQDRLDTLYNAIMPLLTNLKKNPEKEYIYWPDRTGKIEQFEQKLLDIYQGQ